MNLSVGQELRIVARLEGVIGRARSKATSDPDTGRIFVQVAIRLDPGALYGSPAVAALRRLAEAGDDLALAVMSAEERTLVEGGLSLEDEQGGGRCLFWVVILKLCLFRSSWTI